ncbi:uncharacterized protein LOC105683194 isoform X2 [Athalia rosae]|uniref:uncharacterized protein LOC105683194 isoform X2 n=1 Tax=Athalia rosae TaxID=37344 RepID=UPI0020346DF8|nr:uncharacterized protein LOC105683194 isoform X2 [Athalia rosae]
MKNILALLVVCHVVQLVHPYYIPLESPPQIIWEVPTEEVIVKRLQESPTGRFMLRMWPSSPPSRPSTKRYLPYHPVARFRGVNPPDTRVSFSMPREISYRNEHASKPALTAGELLSLLTKKRLLVARNRSLRFGMSR